MNDFLSYAIQKLNRSEEITPTSLAWNVIPKFNSIFRNGTVADREKLLSGFLGEADKDEVLSVATRLHRVQTETTKKLFDEVKDSLIISERCVVGIVDSEHKEYTGLLASKLLGEYKKVAFVLRPVNPTQYSGSMRSPFPIASIINESRLAKAEGHECASGLIMPKANLKKLLKYLDSHLTNDVICDTIDVTARLTPQQINLPLCMNCEEYKDMWGSAGSGVVEPTFYVKFTCYQNWVRLFRKKTTTGKISAYGVDFIKFRLSEEQSAEWEKYDKFTFEAIVTLCTNEWNGRYYPQAMIQQYEIAPKSKVKSLADDDDWRDLF